MNWEKSIDRHTLLCAKSRLIGKDPDAGKDRRQEKGTAQDKMVGWQHWFNGHEFERTLRDSEGQGNMVCCSPWGCRVGHNWATEQQECVKQIASGKLLYNTGSSAQCSVMTQKDGMVGWEKAQEGGHICIHIADAQKKLCTETVGVQKKLTQHCTPTILKWS